MCRSVSERRAGGLGAPGPLGVLHATYIPSASSSLRERGLSFHTQPSFILSPVPYSDQSCAQPTLGPGVGLVNSARAVPASPQAMGAAPWRNVLAARCNGRPKMGTAHGPMHGLAPMACLARPAAWRWAKGNVGYRGFRFGRGLRGLFPACCGRLGDPGPSPERGFGRDRELDWGCAGRMGVMGGLAPGRRGGRKPHVRHARPIDCSAPTPHL